MPTKLKNILHQLNRRDIKSLPKVPKFFKIILIIICLVSAGLLVKNSLVQASMSDASNYLTEDAVNKNPLKQKQDAIKTGNNQESWINESLASNATSGLVAVTGGIPDDVLAGKKTSWVPGGLLGQTTKYISYLYIPQASGIQYIAQNIGNFLGKPAFAQGIGTVGLEPLLPLWKGLRNAVYLVISLVFVVIGIMIMLRVKISPQAVINIQNSIPKLISTLILVTFSYAIAGLLIDFTYVISGLVVNLMMSSIASNPDISNIFSGTITGDVFKSVLSSYSPDVQNAFYQTFSTKVAINPNLWIMSALMAKMVPFFAISWLSLLIGAALTPFTVGISNIFGLLGAILLPLVISIMILIWMIKFLIGLMKCYLNVLLKIILAPLEIGLGAIPNMKMGFSSWFIDLVANISVFPISVIFIILVDLIINSLYYSNGSIWTPEILFVGNVGATTAYIIGLAAMMLLPKLPTLIPEAIFQLKPSPFGKAIGESAAPIGKMVGGSKDAARAGLEKGGDYISTKYGSPGTTWRQKNLGEKAATAFGNVSKFLNRKGK